MNLVMADGNSLPFVGFVELSVETGGMCLEKVGFLIIRNGTVGGVILGSNLFRLIYTTNCFGGKYYMSTNLEYI